MTGYSKDPEFADEDILGKNPDTMNVYDVVYTPEEALPRFANDTVIGFDIETDGFSPWANNPALIQMYGQQTGTVYLQRTPGGHIPESLLDFMENHEATFVGHNIANFDIPFMATHGLRHKNVHKWFDTLIAEALVVGINRKSVKKSLGASIRRRLGMTIDKDIEHSNWAAPTLSDRQVEYAVQDVVHLPALMEVQWQKAFESGQGDAMELEMSLVPIVATMRLNGLPIAEEMFSDFIEKQHDLRDKALLAFAKEFPGVNPRSPVKLRQAIINKGVMVRNTRAQTLKKMLYFGKPHESHIAKVILDYREPDQIIKVYGGDFLTNYLEPDGRLHPNIWTCFTDTTRFSSSNPNGQQIPGSMRSIFRATPDQKYVAPDYSQLEVRVEADLADDQVLIDLLFHEDIHTMIASAIFGVPKEEVSYKLRKLSKALVFTLMFGGTARTVYNYARAEGGDITEFEAEDAYKKFFARFQGLTALHELAVQQSYSSYVSLRLPYGYRRILDRGNKKPTVILNTMVQGTAAVGTKLALLEMAKQGLDKYLGMQLHDEFIAGIVPNSEAVEYDRALAEVMQSEMQKLMSHGAPIRVEGQVAQSWAGGD